jgi:hypothetical protein
MVSSLGGSTLAILEVFLLWRDTQKIVKRKISSSSGILLRLLESGLVILVFLRFFEVNVFLFLISFSIVYFALVFWLGTSWRDADGRNI